MPEFPLIAVANAAVRAEPHWVWPVFEGEPVATFLPGNILDGGDVIGEYRTAIRGRAVVVWTGSLARRGAEDGDDGYDGADSQRWLFTADPRTWGPAGRAALAAALDRLRPIAAEAGVELWLRPHCRHVLADQQACLHFARWLHTTGVPATGPGGVRVLLDPASAMTRAMMPLAEDHLMRFAAGLQLWLHADLRARLAGVMLASVVAGARPAADAGGAEGAEWEVELGPDGGAPCRLTSPSLGELPVRGLAGVARALYAVHPEAWLITT